MIDVLARKLARFAFPSIVMLIVTFAATPAGAADPTFPFRWDVDASTHLRKLNQTVTVPRGTFSGHVDLVTGQLTGDIALPPAKTTVRVAGLPVATATFALAEVQPVSGHVDFATLHTSATAVFDIRILSLTPAGPLPINLVGSSCVTAHPVVVTMSGTASLTSVSTFSGTYTIPPLEHCGLATAALDAVVPGPGNTFTAVASPS